MSDLKVGDRVAVYGCNRITWETVRGVGQITRTSKDGEMIEIESNASTFSEGRFDLTVANAKQCRRIKRKERRRVWIRAGVVDRVHSNDHELSQERADISRFKIKGDDIEFVEVRRKK